MTAIVTVPFASSLRSLGLDRRVPDDAPVARGLATVFAPNALGPAERYFGPLNYIEIVGYLGAPAFLLVVAGVAVLLFAGRPDRRGVLLGVTALGGAVMLAYSYGVEPFYDLFRRLPVLATNPAMRVKSTALLLLALASGLGLDALVRSRLRPRVRWLCTAAVLGAGAFVVIYLSGFARLANADLSDYVTGEVVRACIITVLAAGAILVLVHRPPWRRATPVAVGALICLTIVDAVAWIVPYWPRSEPDTLYPVTDAHAFLADELGDDRFAALGLTFFPGTSAYYGLRAVNGHVFHDPAWVEALEAAGASMRSPTFSPFDDPASASSPVLDRLGVRFWADPAGTPRCDAVPASASGTIASSRSVSSDGPGVRGVVVTPATSIPAGTVLSATASGAGGPDLAGEFELPSAVPAGQPVTIGIAGLEQVEGPFEVRVDSSGALELDGSPVACRAPDDGLSLVHTSGAWIYDRERALDRIRFAGSAVVEPDAGRRLELLASGTLDDGTVVLGEGPSSTADSAGEVLEVRDDGGDTLWITVESDGPGHVVIADAIQNGWEATVDGEPAEIVSADHSGAAVAVGAGVHEVVLSAQPPGETTGVLVSAAAVAVTLGLFAAGLLRRRRAPAAGPAGSDRPAPPPGSDPGAPT
jgi:hypothetical protein